MRIASMSAVVCLALSVAACGSIKETARVSAPENKELVAGIGDQVLTVELQESLPNIFGKADVFGRKRAKGRIVVTYAGLRDGKALFERTDIDVISNATTMNSGAFISNNSQTTFNAASTNGTMVSGTATTTGGGTYVPGTSSDRVAGSRGRLIEIPLQSNGNAELVVSGKEIVIISATAGRLRYKIR